MLLSPFIERLQGDVKSIALLGDQHTRDVADSLSRAMESAIRTTLTDALVAMAHELGNASVSLDGDSVTFVTPHEVKEQTLPASDRNARFALRLPEDLKQGVERAAERSGLSVNSWIVNTLHDSLHQAPPAPPSSGKSVRGRGRA